MDSLACAAQRHVEVHASFQSSGHEDLATSKHGLHMPVAMASAFGVRRATHMNGRPGRGVRQHPRPQTGLCLPGQGPWRTRRLSGLGLSCVALQPDKQGAPQVRTAGTHEAAHEQRTCKIQCLPGPQPMQG